MKGTTQGGGGGETVPVDGCHIIRSTGKKDRHSKVYTAKGPRDRRVRLSAHTAIQFYDVQDRLGYDRPSKAVDWLIKKAKAAIDNLDEPPPPPPWQQPGAPTPDSNPSSSDLAIENQSHVVCEYNFQNNNNDDDNNNNAARCCNSAFLVAATGEADVMNTMKSFFPTSSFAGFDNDPCQVLSFQAEDLGLSLQTFQTDSQAESDMPFQGSFQRIGGWNGGAGIFSQGLSSFAQRELLQSNAAANPWTQRPLTSANHHDRGRGRDRDQPRSAFELGFRVPARIYGEEEAAGNHR